MCRVYGNHLIARHRESGYCGPRYCITFRCS